MRTRTGSAERSRSWSDRLAGHETPGALLKGPPITIRCQCERSAKVHFPERWDCGCGLSWDTAQIDAAEYGRLRNLQTRFRLVPIGLGLGFSLLALLFLTIGNPISVFFLLPAFLVVWGALVRPQLRRRYARALGELPTWELTPVGHPNSVTQDPDIRP